MGQGRRMIRNLWATVIMFFGASMVFGTVAMINKTVQGPREVRGPGHVDFSVKKVEKKKKKEVKIERRKKKVKQTIQPLTLLPDLCTDISGIRIGVPDFEATDLGLLSDGLLGDMNDVVMTEDSVDNRPVPKVRASIEYPARARAANVTGVVVLNLLIGSDGLVKRVKVLEATPPGVFEQNTIDAVKAWIFEPATYEQRNVEVWAKQTIRFNLS